MTTSKQDKFLINCQEGLAHLERATITFVIAASASKTAETAVFITSDAAELCVNGSTSGLQHPGMEPIDDLITQFVSNGGQIWLCPICAKTKGIAEGDLRPGVSIAGAPKTMAFISSGARLLF